MVVRDIAFVVCVSGHSCLVFWVIKYSLNCKNDDQFGSNCDLETFDADFIGFIDVEAFPPFFQITTHFSSDKSTIVN